MNNLVIQVTSNKRQIKEKKIESHDFSLFCKKVNIPRLKDSRLITHKVKKLMIEIEI